MLVRVKQEEKLLPEAVEIPVCPHFCCFLLVSTVTAASRRVLCRDRAWVLFSSWSGSVFKGVLMHQHSVRGLFDLLRPVVFTQTLIVRTSGRRSRSFLSSTELFCSHLVLVLILGEGATSRS